LKLVFKMDTKIKLKLRRFVNKLDSIRGRHTELVSVYIPAGYEMTKIISHLAQEQGTATNIKDKQTRNNVISSLEKMIRHLRVIGRTPKNGFAIFAGNTSKKEGQPNIEVFSVEPPEKLNIRTYRCDQSFLTEHLKQFMEYKEVYGLIVIDRREGNIGLLKGTNIVKLAGFTSNVPGKTTKGGQCLSKDSVVQINDGCLEKIKKLHNPYVVKSIEFEKGKLLDSPVIDKWDTTKKVYKIITQTPRLEIESSPDHVFFVRNEKGIIEKSADELKEGDFLIMPEKIDVNSKLQKLNFKDFKYLDQKFAQFLGYFIGDGNFDNNRLNFSEGDEELVKYYKLFFDELFSLDTKVKFRESKNFYQSRIHSKELVDFLKENFKELKKSGNSEIPRAVLKSNNEVLAGFIRGFFDAEGYCAPEELSLGVNNKFLIKQLQMALLRFSIIGSFSEYDNKQNKYSDNFRYTLRITDIESLKNFKEFIGFSLERKNKKLDDLINKRTNRNNVRQIFNSGKNIRRVLENHGYLKENFPSVSHFFYNRREMGKSVFEKSIIEQIKDDKKIYCKLKEFLNYNLLPVKIKKIESSDNEIEMSDISVKNQNFIANCVLVHNSQQRYARLRDIAAAEFFKRVGDAANKEFLEMKNLKGILVGGPGPTKEDFLRKDYINNNLKLKVIAVKDLGYTGSFGLNELVDKSQDILANEVIIEEKKIMQEFFQKLATESDKVSYGKDEVKKALEMGAVKTLLLSETVNDRIMEEFEKLAEASGSEINIISIETREGSQLKDLGEIAAILRFPVY